MTYRTLRQGEIIPPNAEFLCEGEWVKTYSAGLLPPSGVEYRVPIHQPPTPTTPQEDKALICAYCEQPILESASILDDRGDHLHLDCAAEEDDNVGFDGCTQDQ